MEETKSGRSTKAGEKLEDDKVEMQQVRDYSTTVVTKIPEIRWEES